MKQRDIDRWVNRQNRINRQAAMPAFNWAAITVVIAIILVVLFMLLGATNVL